MTISLDSTKTDAVVNFFSERMNEQTLFIMRGEKEKGEGGGARKIWRDIQ